MLEVVYQMDQAKAALRGAMGAIRSGSLESWELKEFRGAQRACIETLSRLAVGLKAAKRFQS